MKIKQLNKGKVCRVLKEIISKFNPKKKNQNQKEQRPKKKYNLESTSIGRKLSVSCPKLIFRGASEQRKSSRPFILSDISLVESEFSGVLTFNTKSDISEESFDIDHPVIIRMFNRPSSRQSQKI